MDGLKLLVEVPAECLGELFTKGIGSVIDRCNVSHYNDEPIEWSPDLNEQPENSLDKAVKRNPMFGELRFVEEEKEKKARKLIKYRCEDCGRVNWSLVEKHEDGKYYLPCNQCHINYSFTEEDLKRVEYECWSCGETVYFFTTKERETTISRDYCRKCRSVNYVQ